LTVLGGVGEVEGFDVFWEAARSVVGSLVGPESYPHHSVGEIGVAATLVAAAGWTVTGTQRMVGVRRCGREELWRWLWGSLPLRFEDGSFLEGAERAGWEHRIRDVFEPLAQRWATDGSEVSGQLSGSVGGKQFDVPSVAWMVSAIAPAHVPSAVTLRCEVAAPSDG
jgi:hypothetical protein